MSPSGLSWLQGCLFLFLGVVGGVAGAYGLNRCQSRRRTSPGTSHVELSSIRVESRIATAPLDDAQSSGSEEEAGSPSTFSNPFGEVMASTWFLSCSDRNRLRSESLRRPNSLLEPSAEIMKKSHFLESVAQTEVPNLARRETAYSTTVANRTPSPMSSPTARLLRPSGGEDEALSSSDPAGEALALPGTPSRPDRERCRSNSCRGMIEPEERTKSPLEKFMAKDESRNVGRSESANMIIADSVSTTIASTTAVRRRPRRRHPGRHSVPKASRKIPLVDHPQASTLDGLHRRPRISQEPSGEIKNYRGIRHRLDRRKWVAAMKPPNSKNKCSFGDFESELQAACAVDAAYFYYERPYQTNILHSTPAMMTMLPTLPAGLNNKDKLRFVKAKLLAKYAADNLEAVNPSFGRQKQR